MLRSSIHLLFAPSAVEAASRALPLLLPLWGCAAQQQFAQYPHMPSLQRSAAYSNSGIIAKQQRFWHSSCTGQGSSSSLPQPAAPLLTSSRCITTSAAAAAAADTASQVSRLDHLSVFVFKSQGLSVVAPAAQVAMLHCTHSKFTIACSASSAQCCAVCQQRQVSACH
jgi:hypothetical protein